MKKVVFVLNNGPRAAIVDENATIRDILNEEGVAYEGRMVSVDGACLHVSDFNTILADLTEAEIPHISVTAKSDNAAEATVIANALIVTSALKLEDLETIKKYRPKALRMYEKDEDGMKSEVFRLDVKDGTGEISKIAVVYGKTTDAEGRARLTMAVDPVDPEAIKDKYGPALVTLAKLEETLAGVALEIAAEKADIESRITFA